MQHVVPFSPTLHTLPKPFHWPEVFAYALVVPVSKGEPIRYVKVPVLVRDIDIKDEKTGETYTLDGVFGMNYLVASASVSGGLTGGGVDDLHDGAFDQFVIDHANKTLGLKLRNAAAKGL